MYRKIGWAIALALGGCVSSAPAYAYEFKAPSVNEYWSVHIQTNQIYKTKQLPSFNAFADMLANGWVNAHRQQALEKSKDVLAKPEFVWELPYANDWIGCMFFQFKNADVFENAGFESFNTEPMLNGWISKNEERLSGSTDTKEFVETLKVLPDIASKCEDIVREQPPEGANNI